MLREINPMSIIPLCDIPWPASVDTVDACVAGVVGEAFLFELSATGGLT